jgi:tRNA threonylcarbamoyladenosine biosynthesis protein TsaE
MEKTFITTSAKQTQKLGELLALELKGGEAICLDGELGAGKTTFTQGLLKGLGAQEPYTSPTFLIMKQYEISAQESVTKSQDRINNVFHFDAYRVEAKDLLELGWEEILSDEKNITIIEWSERVKKILPKNSLQIIFEWVDENKRKIIFKNKFTLLNNFNFLRKN